MKKRFYYVSIILLILATSACQNAEKKTGTTLHVIASSTKQWTGLAISSQNRIFVNYPKWSQDVPVSVAEIVDGKTRAYPNENWNNNENKEAFLAVQSVVVDKKNRLWVLDTKNPFFKGIVEGGPILYQFNLKTNTKEKAYRFPKTSYRKHSYFNDVRIDTKREIAYISDSGTGALIVLNLKTGTSRRLLDNHFSTKSELDSLICVGQTWNKSVHSDGIALSPDLNYLYYSALTGHTLYRISTSVLSDLNLSKEQVADKVEKVMSIPATDGMLFDKAGNLWLGGLENNSINKINTKGTLIQLIQDKSIRWPDSFAEDSKGNIYFTTSQIYLPENKRQAYKLIQFNLN
ncbi:L-dopachrome tautomerase-related protein [Marinifilum sp. RC60d5]|uniref:L-dopachrome tautomerase-related protein n=1 Tax=Marinifilum sp. RC60d5 TaxID=3458414 RepID=UPI004035E141